MATKQGARAYRFAREAKLHLERPGRKAVGGPDSHIFCDCVSHRHLIKPFKAKVSKRNIKKIYMKKVYKFYVIIWRLKINEFLLSSRGILISKNRLLCLSNFTARVALCRVWGQTKRMRRECKYLLKCL